MFVGASPSSTAGGIRTTTLMIVIWTIFSKIAGRSDIVMFKRKIPNAKVRASLLTTVVATMLVALFAIIVFYCAPDSNSQYTVLQSFYEVSSAFGTVGLSMGFTSSINVAGLFFLIIIMFIGQLGISSTLLA
jgi:Trk-type K+ transport system membrane component